MIQRTAHCFCGNPIFFRNHLCLHCGRALGYAPEQSTMLSLDAVAGGGAGSVPLFRTAGPSAEGELYVRCGNFSLAPQCNWLVPQSSFGEYQLCRCCRLNRTIPDQSIGDNAEAWHKAELAKRRLVSSLIALGLPVASRQCEDMERGLAFDLLLDADPAGITTGHSDGIITLNLNEADDATRRATQTALQEPYRTLLGHVRHESGHYYWHRLMEASQWHVPFRTLFGDERQNYDAALYKHYNDGPSPTWADHCVSAYASAHPWEDWAETWAHYLHMVDALDTAKGFAMKNISAEWVKDPFVTGDLYSADGASDTVDDEFLGLVNAWTGLSSALNEFTRGMGLADFYPFVLSHPAVTKLHFVHCFVKAAGAPSSALVQESAMPVPGACCAPKSLELCNK